MTTHLTRWAKLAGVAGIALHLSLAAFGNIVDPETNLAFVRHVLAMDTTFQRPAVMGRAITDPGLHSAAYWLIVAAEIGGAVLLWWGAARLWRARSATPETFHAAKGLAVFALMWCFSIWMVGFVAIGGEWFAMWQSSSWNGQEGAARFATLTGIVMLFVAMRD